MNIEAIPVEPLTREAFNAFGDVVQLEGAERRLINMGSTERFHDLAGIDVAAENGRPIVNIFRGQPFAPPIEIAMMERHPLGSQMFYPLSGRPFLAVVAPDEGGKPGEPRAFLCGPEVGVNYARNVWHHPLLSLMDISDFMVVDRAGPGDNLEEYEYADIRYRIDAIEA